jgi:alkaline phosphatase D
VLGNSVQMTSIVYPDVPETRGLGYVDSGLGFLFNNDAWDGYLAERELVLGTARAARADLVALTGDIHSTWAGNLRPGAFTGTAPAGTEFVCTSVTSDNVNDILGAPEGNPVSARFSQVLPAINAGRVPLVELDRHGCSVVEVTAQRVQCDWWYVSDRTRPDATMSPGYSAQTLRGSRVVTPVAAGFAAVPLVDDGVRAVHAGRPPRPTPQSLGLTGPPARR